MDRTIAKALIIVGGVAIGLGSLLPWIASRGMRPQLSMTHTRFIDLFHWAYGSSSDFLHSFALIGLVLGLLVIIGGVVAYRFVVITGALLALASGSLYVALKNAQYNPIDMPYSDLRLGAWLFLAGGLLALLVAFWKWRAE